MLRTVTTAMLLMPQTPMLFQGQEFAASQPFYYFADHQPELAKLVREGRTRELSQFPSAATKEIANTLVDPSDEKTFRACKLDHAERSQGTHAEVFQLHKDLLRLRREHAAFRRVNRRGDIDGAVLGPSAFVLRYFGETAEDDRLLLVNLGLDLPLSPAPEPLLAPSLDRRWSLLFSSESFK